MTLIFDDIHFVLVELHISMRQRGRRTDGESGIVKGRAEPHAHNKISVTYRHIRDAERKVI